MKKYTLICVSLLLFGACSLFGTHRLDYINVYAVAVPYVPTNMNMQVDYGDGGGLIVDTRFIILKEDVIHETVQDEFSTSEYHKGWTYFSVIIPQGGYCVDKSGSQYEFTSFNIAQDVSICSEQKMYPEWFLVAVDTLNVSGSNYTVYRMASYEEQRSNMNINQLEGLYTVSWSYFTSAMNYRLYTIPTNYYEFTLGNSSNAIPAFAAEYTNVTVNATTYALHRALEQKYYPSNGKIVVTVNGWTTNTN